MPPEVIDENFYDKIWPLLHRKIGRELSLARNVLDIGCGACELVEYLAHTYHQNVTGVDVSGGGFPKHRSSRGGRMRCIRKNARNLNFVSDEFVDAAVMMWSFHEMEYPERILEEVHRVLRPGGKILIVDFPRDSLARRLWGEDYYTPAGLKKKVVAAGFAEVKVRLSFRKQILWSNGFRPIEE